jgi:hypothetical protein
VRSDTPELQVECTASVGLGVLHHRHPSDHRADQPRAPRCHHQSEAVARSKGIIRANIHRKWAVQTDHHQPSAEGEAGEWDRGDPRRKDDSGETAAAGEGAIPDLGDTRRKDDSGEAPAATEGEIPDLGDTRREDGSGEATAALERGIPDLGDTLG